MGDDDKKLPIEPVPETEPAKKRRKEEEFFQHQEARKIEKLKEKLGERPPESRGSKK